MKTNKITKIKDALSLKEKTALIWTIPLVFALVSCLSIFAIVFFVSVFILNITGTTGATIYLFDMIKLKIIDRKLKKLIKTDEKLHRFEAMINRKDENTSSNAS